MATHPTSPSTAPAVARAGPLVAEALGATWEDLPAAVRRLHARGRARGTFRVRRGTTLLARGIASAFGLPRDGGRVSVRLAISSAGGGETWTRRFDGQRLVSRVELGADGVLVETFRGVACVFRASVTPDGAEWRQVGAGLALGRLRVPLPGLLAPSVRGTERARDDGGVAVSVEISWPLAGLLVAYDGVAHPEPEP